MTQYHSFSWPLTSSGTNFCAHVAIIGAGASIAACPYDKNGKTLPVLSNIHNVLGLTQILEGYDFPIKLMENFEELYSKIYEDPACQDLRVFLEEKISTYFAELEIPDSITVYDYLILSLTSQDTIISFNWDPLLLQAYRRNSIVGNLPQLAFVHGNAGLGVCYQCKQKGYVGDICIHCHKKLERCPLLYPIGQKNYSASSIIKNEWIVAKDALERAGGVTIFGYNMPLSDKEAYHLMKSSFKRSHREAISWVDIINIEGEKAIQLKKWTKFYDERMVRFCTDFKDSHLWEFPRATVESSFEAVCL